jgi:DNA repair photolyase
VRWATADDEPDGLFPVMDLFTGEHGSGRMSQLEFLPVLAHSVLNHVPKSPFPWTINAYRGCSHACVYCLAGDTPILLADGRTQPLARIAVGDEVYGTVRRGNYLRYTPTPVLAHWRTVKRAFRVTLGDGTQLVASADHRFLTDRGWKFVHKPDGPHLTTNDSLLGMGRLASSPTHSADYRVGYLTGMIRGDAHIGRYTYQREGRAPAISRKRGIDGTAIKTEVDLRVAAVKDLGIELPMYDITTGTGDFIANGVVSHNCFARPTHEYLDMNAGSDFDTKIVVKVNAVDVLKRELANPHWQREKVAMGTNTDPYQRAEAKFRLTRGIIAALIDAETPFSILTKSPLVTRDLDLIAPAAKHLDISVAFSIPTVDERAWRLSEPGTPHPQRRVDAMHTMVDAGVRTGALMAPILPGLSDRRDQLADTIAAIKGTGGELLHAHAVYLRGATRDHFMSWLADTDPALHARYERGISATGDVSDEYKNWLREAIASETR